MDHTTKMERGITHLYFSQGPYSENAGAAKLLAHAAVGGHEPEVLEMMYLSVKWLAIQSLKRRIGSVAGLDSVVEGLIVETQMTLAARMGMAPGEVFFEDEEEEEGTTMRNCLWAGGLCEVCKSGVKFAYKNFGGKFAYWCFLEVFRRIRSRLRRSQEPAMFLEEGADLESQQGVPARSAPEIVEQQPRPARGLGLGCGGGLGVFVQRHRRRRGLSDGATERESGSLRHRSTRPLESIGIGVGGTIATTTSGYRQYAPATTAPTSPPTPGPQRHQSPNANSGNPLLAEASSPTAQDIQRQIEIHAHSLFGSPFQDSEHAFAILRVARAEIGAAWTAPPGSHILDTENFEDGGDHGTTGSPPHTADNPETVRHLEALFVEYVVAEALNRNSSRRKFSSPSHDFLADVSLFERLRESMRQTVGTSDTVLSSPNFYHNLASVFAEDFSWSKPTICSDDSEEKKEEKRKKLEEMNAGSVGDTVQAEDVYWVAREFGKEPGRRAASLKTMMAVIDEEASSAALSLVDVVGGAELARQNLVGGVDGGAPEQEGRSNVERIENKSERMEALTKELRELHFPVVGPDAAHLKRIWDEQTGSDVLGADTTVGATAGIVPSAEDTTTTPDGQPQHPRPNINQNRNRLHRKHHSLADAVLHQAAVLQFKLGIQAEFVGVYRRDKCGSFSGPLRFKRMTQDPHADVRNDPTARRPELSVCWTPADPVFNFVSTLPLETGGIELVPLDAFEKFLLSGVTSSAAHWSWRAMKNARERVAPTKKEDRESGGRRSPPPAADSELLCLRAAVETLRTKFIADVEMVDHAVTEDEHRRISSEIVLFDNQSRAALAQRELALAQARKTFKSTLNAVTENGGRTRDLMMLRAKRIALRTGLPFTTGRLEDLFHGMLGGAGMQGRVEAAVPEWLVVDFKGRMRREFHDLVYYRWRGVADGWIARKLGKV